MTNRQTKIKKLVKALFKDDSNKPFELTESQIKIVEAILYKESKRVQIIAPRQYGKSSAVAIGMILASNRDKQGYAVVAGSQKKADIIMQKVIQHTFDNPIYMNELDFKGESLERIKRERSQKRITWKSGGEIEAISADAKNRAKCKEALMGLGKQNVIEDESSLITDDLHETVVSMLGGYKDNFLLKIGNPFYRNHFLRSWEDERYSKIFIDYKQALKEGRYTEDYIEEMRGGIHFSILYECKFPAEDEFIEGGYRKLIKKEKLEKAFITEGEFNALCTKEITNRKGQVIKVPEGEPIMGCDFAGMGSDRNSYVIRWDKVMKLMSTNQVGDTMQQIPKIQEYADLYNIEAENVYLDYGGLGQGIGDRLQELEFMANNIMFGSKAQESQNDEGCKNIRAYMYYNLEKWIREGGKIVADKAWQELLVVYYKTDSEKKFQIQSKIDLKKKMAEAGMQVTSPDVADAGALTFAGGLDQIGEDDFDFM